MARCPRAFYAAWKSNLRRVRRVDLHAIDAMSVPHRSTEPARPGHRREMSAPDTRVDFHAVAHGVVGRRLLRREAVEGRQVLQVDRCRTASMFPRRRHGRGRRWSRSRSRPRRRRPRSIGDGPLPSQALDLGARADRRADLRGASRSLDAVRTAPKSEKKPPTASSPGDDSYQGSEGASTRRDAESAPCPRSQNI